MKKYLLDKNSDTLLLIFDVSAQKEFYKNRLRLVENARHNIFYRIKSFSQMINYHFSR